MVEACLVCFDDRGHKSGVQLRVTGTYNDIFAIIWEDDINDNMGRFWKDEEVTTEYAAYGIAILLIRELTEFTAIQRSAKGTGFDYWLGVHDEDAELPFQNMARLEVSGIRQGNAKLVSQRVRQKLDQTSRSDGVLPAYITVVEFSEPMAQVVKK